MKIFNLDDEYSVVCNFKSTRSGFKHIAVLYKNGTDIYKTKVCYLNRTWEAYEYETILKKVIYNFFEKCPLKEKFIEVIKN